MSALSVGPPQAESLGRSLADFVPCYTEQHVELCDVEKQCRVCDCVHISLLSGLSQSISLNELHTVQPTMLGLVLGVML